MITSLALISSKAPFSESNGKEALDIALIFGSFEQDIAIFFHGDGVWQLVAEHQGELLGVKDFLKTLPALPFYDVEQVFVCQKSLDERQITKLMDIEGLLTLPVEKFNQKLASFKHILRF